MKITRRRFFLLSGTTVLAVNFPGIGRAQSAAASQVLRYGHDIADISSLDPAFTVAPIPEYMLMTQVYDPLVRFANGRVSVSALEPALATKWEPNSDYTQWTFTLREGVLFHEDIAELTATDVKFTFERLFREQSPHASTFAHIGDIEAPDDRTVIFNLKDVDREFPLIIAGTQGSYIVSEKAVQDRGDAFRYSPIGTGPFKVDSHEPNRGVTMVRHDQYWEGQPSLEGIENVFISDRNTRTLAFKSGDLHMMFGEVDPSWVKNIRAQGFVADVTIGTMLWLHVNMSRPPFDDLKVRQALAHGIDKEKLLEYHGVLGRRMPGPLYEVYEPVAPESALAHYEYNPERARQLLSEAGHPDGFEVDVWISERSNYLVPAQIVQADLKAVGIILKLNVVDHTSFHQKNRADANALIFYAHGDVPLAKVVLRSFWHSQSIVGKPTARFNFSHYGEQGGGIDELLDKADSETDQKEADRLYISAQSKIMKDLPTIPLVARGFPNARQSYVDLGYEFTDSGALLTYGYMIDENTRILKQ